MLTVDLFQLLHTILSPLPTPSLLPVTRVSHRLCDVTLRILHHRLALAASLGDRTLLLECYHPSVKLTESPILCKHLGTRGLDDAPSARTINETTPPPGQTLHEYNNLYSRFWPYREEQVKTRRRYRHPAGDIPGSRTYFQDPPPEPDVSSQQHANSLSATSTSGPGSNGETVPGTGAVEASVETTVYNTVRQLVNLDSGELFSQLRATTTLVKIGPKGLFFSTVAVSDGVIRVFRNWLAENSRHTARDDKNRSASRGEETSSGGMHGCEECAADNACEGGACPKADQQSNCNDDDHPAVLWVNDGQNVGVRFSVRERRRQTDKPILYQHEDELALSYEIQFEGKHYLCSPWLSLLHIGP